MCRSSPADRGSPWLTPRGPAARPPDAEDPEAERREGDDPARLEELGGHAVGVEYPAESDASQGVLYAVVDRVVDDPEALVRRLRPGGIVPAQAREGRRVRR